MRPRKAAPRPRSEPEASEAPDRKAAPRPRSEPEASEAPDRKAAPRPRSEPEASEGRQPLVIAHRGASGQRPENTLAAFELAVEQRADMIEIDLHLTRDGALVVLHDERPAGLGGREVAEVTLQELRVLDVGGGEKVPTLAEVLDAFGDRIPFNLELKRGARAEYEGLEAAVVKEVRRRGLMGRTLFSSFYDGVLARLRALDARARLGLLVSRKFPAGALRRAQTFGAEALNLEVPVATSGLLAEAHAAALAVYVFTVDEPAVMRRLLAAGADGLFTNHPDRLRRLLGGVEG